MAEAVGDERQGIQSVENAMKILAALESGGAEMTLSEIAQRAGEPPNKVHRYLVSLGRIGMTVQSSANGRYDFGPAMRRLGAEALRRTNEVAVAADFTAELRDATHHSINTTVWGDDGPVIVRWDYGAHPLPLSFRVGSTLPVTTSSAGFMFLATLPPLMTAGALERSLATIADPERGRRLETIVERVKRDGYAIQTGGVISGISSVSAAVQTAADSLPFVISIIVPSERVEQSEWDDLTPQLLETVRLISEQLGGAQPRQAS